jgi:hypothetical protein
MKESEKRGVEEYAVMEGIYDESEGKVNALEGGKDENGAYEDDISVPWHPFQSPTFFLACAPPSPFSIRETTFIRFYLLLLSWPQGKDILSFYFIGEN